MSTCLDSALQVNMDKVKELLAVEKLTHLCSSCNIRELGVMWVLCRFRADDQLCHLPQDLRRDRIGMSIENTLEASVDDVNLPGFSIR